MTIKSTIRPARNEHQAAFIKAFNSLSGKYSRWEIWADFVTMTATAISNTVDKENAPARESTYIQIAKKYTSSELKTFARMFSMITDGMEANPDMDFLGELYMACELGNDAAGQFFTPYDICRMTASTAVSNVRSGIEEKGWISVNDPACGAGALLVAFANECRSNGVNYQESVLFAAQDIDHIVGMMCYIQLSVLGCPGYVYIGNTLTNPSTALDQRGLIPNDTPNVWFTPFYYRTIWRLRILEAMMGLYFEVPAEKPAEPQKQRNGKQGRATKKSPTEPVATPDIAKIEADTHFTESAAGQLSFF